MVILETLDVVKRIQVEVYVLLLAMITFVFFIKLTFNVDAEFSITFITSFIQHCHLQITPNITAHVFNEYLMHLLYFFWGGNDALIRFRPFSDIDCDGHKLPSVRISN